jgi:hypothetical protein
MSLLDSYDVDSIRFSLDAMIAIAKTCRLISLLLSAGAALLTVMPGSATAQSVPAQGAPEPAIDGRRDFDFLLGNWKAHLKRLPERLVGSTRWIEYDGVSRTHPMLGSSANLEEFEVDSPAAGLHIKGQTLRLYNIASGQWFLYLIDVDKGLLPMPPTVGQFADGRGEFYDQEEYQGRMILVRYVWTHASTASARMEQAFSVDGGKNWEVNWICELTREKS